MESRFSVMRKIPIVVAVQTIFLSGGAPANAQSSLSGNDSHVSIPRIAGDYVNVYKPGGDIYPGPNVAGLMAGQFYGEWVPNDHCFVRDASGRWHAFGITHPLTDVANVHAGECLLFHALAPPGTLKAALQEGSWTDRPKILPSSERPHEAPAIHAPWILKRHGRFHMVYGPTPMRQAVSHDLSHWTPKGRLEGAPSGRDPHIFMWNDVYHLIVCGVHDVRIATSRDLRSWTARGAILRMKQGVDPESPSVVRYASTFYLFVCGWNGVWDRKDVQGAYQHKTYVYQSDDPLRFELDNEVAILDAHAPEIFQDEAGDWYISSAEWPHRGVSIARLVWEKKWPCVGVTDEGQRHSARGHGSKGRQYPAGPRPVISAAF
jgi:beta-fructofuranosidase